MRLNFDAPKHILGLLAVAAIPAAGDLVGHTGVAHAGVYRAGTVLLLGFVAFLCGAQSEAVFLSDAQKDVKDIVEAVKAEEAAKVDVAPKP